MRRFLSAELLLLLLLVGKYEAIAQSPSCEFFQNVVVGTTYYVYSPGYPANFGKNLACRWKAVCPDRTRCRLTCSEVNIAPTVNCIGDRLLISKTGDTALTGAISFCKQGTIDIYSNANVLTVGLISTPTSPGGRIMCSLTAEPISSFPTSQVCMCGRKKSARIAGGQQTQINEFPMMVGLMNLNQNNIFCGGTIIHKRYVLTSAHCLTPSTVYDVGIVYGEHDTRLSDSTATKIIKAEKFIIHPQYNEDYDYDIGLVRTGVDIVFSNLVGPACLPFNLRAASLTGALVEALGWGTSSFAGGDSYYLQKATLSVMDPNVCRNTIGAIITPRTMCTYTAGRDTCIHDVGGPILWQDSSTGQEYLLGIIMGKYGCANRRPTVHTRVTEFLPWIQQNSPDAIYCGS